MSKIKQLFGMAYATPAVRTIFQAAAAAGLVVLVNAGVEINSDTLRSALAFALAGGLAKLQELVRG